MLDIQSPPSRKAKYQINVVGWFAVLLTAVLGTASLINQQGTSFYNTGKAIDLCLGQLARALKANDLNHAAQLFDQTYRGQHIGLNNLILQDDKDGVRIYRMSPERSRVNRDGAVKELREYLSTFSSIDELLMHIDRIQKWSFDGSATVTVRFEIIATPKGQANAGIDRAYLRCRFVRKQDRIKVASGELVRGERVISDAPQFRGVAHQAGIDFLNRYYPEFLNQPLRFGMLRYGPAGITAADYDNDGFYDLFIPDGVESKLFRNRGDGTFEDVTAKAGLGGLEGVSVALFADYDNDGYKDLFVSRTFRPNQLFHNNRDGTFTDVTVKAGIGADCCTTVAAWADYDNDGLLDLYVGRYIDPRTKIPTTFYARNGEGDKLYHNNGDGTFTDVTRRAHVGETGLCLGVVWGDYDNDGWPDLYVVNDFGRSTLFHNNRDGTLTDVTVKTNTLAYGAGMSASFADYDNDGKLDIYATHIRSDYAWFAEGPTVRRYVLNSMREGVWRTDMPLYFEIFRQAPVGFVPVFQAMASGNTLLRNKGDGTFDDVTEKSGANPPGWFWGASFGDFDNDGWLDIYAADGWVYNKPDTELELEFLNNVVSHQDTYKTGAYFDPSHFGQSSWHGWERNRYLRNNGDGTFHEIGRATGTDLLLNSRGVAVADFWNRGVLDIAVSASTDRHALLRNEIPCRRNWLQVELVGTKSNRDAVGARINIWSGGKRQMREVVLGDGYGSQNTLRQHFGLDQARYVDLLEVRWPKSGIVQRFRNVPADRIVEVVEGQRQLRDKHYPKPL